MSVWDSVLLVLEGAAAGAAAGGGWEGQRGGGRAASDRPDLPASVHQTVSHLLCHDPEERPSSAAAVIAALASPAFDDDSPAISMDVTPD